MRYDTYSPSPDLVPFIQCYWSLQGSSVGAAGPERILPDGCLELIFNFADVFEEVAEGGALRVQPKVLLVGQMTRYMHARPSGGIDLLAIRFRPAGAARFLSCPLYEFTDTTVSGTEVDQAWGICYEELGNSLASERITILERTLRVRGRDRMNGPLVARVVRDIMRAGGNIRIEDLASRAGMSMSALQRAFQRHVGVRPKLLARIFRVQKALDMHERIATLTVSEIAQRCGYFDQAHFSRDFAAITGLAPATFLRSTHDLADLLRETGRGQCSTSNVQRPTFNV